MTPLSVPEKLELEVLVLSEKVGCTVEHLLSVALGMGVEQLRKSVFPVESPKKPSKTRRKNDRRVMRRDPIPYVPEKNGQGNRRSPAYGALGHTGSQYSCYSCGRSRPFDGGLNCPTCRGRSGMNGWCGCGAALYQDGCYPKMRKQVEAHRAHKRGY